MFSSAGGNIAPKVYRAPPAKDKEQRTLLTCGNSKVII